MPETGELISLSFAQLRASLEAFSRSIMLRSDYGRQVDVKGGSPLVMGGSRQAVVKLECERAKNVPEGYWNYNITARREPDKKMR